MSRKRIEDRNFRRSAIISQNARKNLIMITQANDYMLTETANKEQKEAINKMVSRVRGCAYNSLYKVGTKTEYITSLTCKHKACNVCNWNRQKTVRIKYLLFLEKTPELFIVERNKKYKVVLPEAFNQKTDIYLESVEYDLMHLTLTVPHSKDKGFRNNKYYYKEFAEAFKKLRRQKFFINNIYGGEFGIETTNGDNGLNIHSHSLLMVRKFKQNRNYLHKEILIAWNKLTADHFENLPEHRKNKIQQSNKSLTNKDIDKLSNTGATMIGLENIFTKDKNGNKIRDLDEESKVKAVMETVSYHFAPKMFEKKGNNEFDFNLISNVLIHTQKIRLYERFGVFRQSKLLNLKNSTQIDEFNEANEIKERENEINVSLNGKFFSVNPRKVYHNFDTEEIIINPGTLKQSRELAAINTVQAIEQLNKN